MVRKQPTRSLKFGNWRTLGKEKDKLQVGTGPNSVSCPWLFFSVCVRARVFLQSLFLFAAWEALALHIPLSFSFLNEAGALVYLQFPFLVLAPFESLHF